MSSSTVNCLCGAISFPYHGKLPQSTEVCHCNSCRHTSGAFYEGFAELTSPPPEEAIERCTAFHGSDFQSRLFCTTCGTKLFIHVHLDDDGTKRDESEAWLAIAGAIDPPSDVSGDVVFVEFHKWLADTGDGGAAPFLRKLGGRDVPCHETQDGLLSDSDVDALIERSKKLSTAHNESDMLKVECRCGGVSLRIQRANHADRTISKLDRYLPKDRDGKVENDKHFAATCVCRSCRLQFGVSLAPWLYIPPAQIINPRTGKAVMTHRDATSAAAKEANAGLTLKHYWSSADSCRSFCSGCGAAVFYTTDDRLEITDVAAGLMRAEEGAMARSWVSWQWGQVSWKEEATDKNIMEAWKAALEA